MDDPLVVIAATPRQWAAGLHAHAADHGGVVVRATVLKEADARTEPCDVLIVDDITSFLTASLVAAVHDAGRAVLGVYDPEDTQGKSDMVDAGIDALITADAGPDELVQAVRALVGSRRTRIPSSTRPREVRPVGVQSRVVGVTGPGGGVGVTEIAIELAALMGAAGQPTVLVDADEGAPSHAQRLGMALHPNVLGGIDATRRHVDVTTGLHPLSSRHPLSALPGMAVGQDWARVPHGGLEELATALAARRRRIVLDLGHCPERVEGPTGARFGHASAMAARCTDLVVVCSPTPVALSRTVALYSRLSGSSVALHVVLNRVGGDRFVREEAVAELRRLLGVAQVHVVVEDPRVARAAWQGERVARGRFSRQMASAVRAMGLV